MPLPRYAQISLAATPYYHCVCRCVRRSFLCGLDAATGNSFEHRRQWIEDKLIDLAQIFCIELCAYAVMSNHYHAVLHINQTQGLSLTTQQVIEKWHQLFKGSLLSQRFQRNEQLTNAELAALDKQVEHWRYRLMDISWYMRCMNEAIARQSNQEDNCTGRFWEGRYKCQALLDEAALAACMAYVDLNPIRAAIENTPEQSAHTSIKKRIQKAKTVTTPNHPQQQSKALMAFAGNPRKNMPQGLPFRLTDYIDLVDWTGRIMRDDKRGHIKHSLPPILERLNIEPKHWHYMTRHFESQFKTLVGSAYKLKQTCRQLGYSRTPGIKTCQQYFP
ncbi:MAG: transposase [Gammaproteobacteria bacterium]|nr:transposase [Gammaproteobacteria bacterium]